MRVARLKGRAAALGMRKIDVSATGGYVLFEENNMVDPARVIRLVQEPRSKYRLESSLKLRFQAKLDKGEERFRFIAELLDRLGK